MAVKDVDKLRSEMKQLEEMVYEVIENQKALQKEMKFIRGDIKALNKLSTEMLKVHRIHRDMAKANTKQLTKIEDKIKKK